MRESLLAMLLIAARAYYTGARAIFDQDFSREIPIWVRTTLNWVFQITQCFEQLPRKRTA